MADNKVKLSFDRYEWGITINALNELRSKQIKEQRPTEPIDELIVKLVEAQNRKPSLLKIFRGGQYEYR